jgi:hypothetical protein
MQSRVRDKSIQHIVDIVFRQAAFSAIALEDALLLQRDSNGQVVSLPGIAQQTE